MSNLNNLRYDTLVTIQTTFDVVRFELQSSVDLGQDLSRPARQVEEHAAPAPVEPFVRRKVFDLHVEFFKTSG